MVEVAPKGASRKKDEMMIDTTIAPEDLRTVTPSDGKMTATQHAKERGRREGLAEAYKMQTLARQQTWVLKALLVASANILAARASD